MNNIITIGGSEHFNDFVTGLQQIDNIITKHNINKQDLLVYGYAPNKKGSFLVAKKWATKNKVTFIEANPNPKKHENDWNKALSARNDYVAVKSFLLINFLGINPKNNSVNNGGNGIIECFKKQGKLVESVGELKKERPKVIFNPPKELLQKSIKQFSSFVKGLLPNLVSLDVETTGLIETKDDIIEIAIVEAVTGKTLYNSLIYTETKIGQQAFEKNNITADMLTGKPTLDIAYKKFKGKLNNKIIVASNSEFDEKMLNSGLLKLDIVPPANLWMCLQKLYRNYSLQPKSIVPSLNTERIARQLNIEVGTHRALSDVQAQNLILQAMANEVMPDFTI